MPRNPEPMTRADRVIRFIERYCIVPEGKDVGKPMKLRLFQRKFIRAIYDNEVPTTRAYLSLARKNGKTALIACIILAHLVGPEAVQNSEITVGARSRDQAAQVFKYAWKMVRMNPDLHKIVHPTPSQKKLTGIPMNVEFQAIAAEAATAHGGSPILAVLDEVGQIKGPRDDFVDAIETSQGAYEGKALLICISTQAPTDNDWFSIQLDDQEKHKRPHVVSHVYSAPIECELTDERAWKAANPGLGDFRSKIDVAQYAERAMRLPTDENTFRWLFLNQRIEANAPWITRGTWMACKGVVPESFDDMVTFASLDLSSVNDLTSLMIAAFDEGKVFIKPHFWLPGEGIIERSKADRVPYDVWHKEGYIEETPGKSVEYEWVAHRYVELLRRYRFRKTAFDRWNFRNFRPWLLKAGMEEEEIEAQFVEFGQGYESMSPALRATESEILNHKLVHGDHPVMNMCMSNAVVQQDPAGNRKLSKAKSRGRIDGSVTLAMAVSIGLTDLEDSEALDDFLNEPVMVI